MGGVVHREGERGEGGGGGGATTEMASVFCSVQQI